MKFDSVDKLLNYGVFTIPEYQRGYSWTKDQLNDLTEDLIDVEYIKEHYAGTITLIKSGQEKIGISELTKYDIVDGQQRLTTFHLLLISIYHRFHEINPQEADETIIKNVLNKGKSLLRLNNNSDQEFFFSLLNEKNIATIKYYTPVSKTQRNLLEAKMYFHTFLQRYKSVSSLIKLYNNLCSKFKVNVFELEEESEVGLIFETMNDRGLPLSDIDKVKNYLIYLTHKLNDKRVAKDINKFFGEIFTQLMTIDNYSTGKTENQFLKNSYLIYTGDTKGLSDIPKKIKGELIKQRDIFTKKSLFDNDIEQKNKKIKEIKDFSAFLHKNAKHYPMILNQKFDDEHLAYSFHRISLLGGIEVFLPLYMAILNNSKYKEDYLISINEIIETYMIRVFIFGNKKAGTGSTALTDLAYKINNGKINYTDLKKELRKLIDKNISNTDLKKSIININSYENIDRTALRLILLDYEYFLQDNLEQNFSLGKMKDLTSDNKLTIEHIAPQTSQPGMKDLDNINSIGNLVLSFQNSALGNSTFEAKKKIYGSSNLSSEQELITYEQWDDKTIIERGKKIQKFIMDKWKN